MQKILIALFVVNVAGCASIQPEEMLNAVAIKRLNTDEQKETIKVVEPMEAKYKLEIKGAMINVKPTYKVIVKPGEYQLESIGNGGKYYRAEDRWSVVRSELGLKSPLPGGIKVYDDREQGCRAWSNWSVSNYSGNIVTTQTNKNLYWEYPLIPKEICDAAISDEH